MRFFFLALGTIAALAWCAVRIVTEQHAGMALGYDIAAATRQQRALEDEVRQLSIDRAALLDPTLLEPAALRHGYRVPRPDEVVVVRTGEGTDGR